MSRDVNKQTLSLLTTVLIAVLIYVIAAFRYTGFATAAVFINLLDDNAFLGIAAVGMTFVILSGGIDLSVGAVMGLASITSAVLIEKAHLSPFVAIPGILLAGALFGALMGWLIARFELVPFLVTLAGLFFARGLAYSLSLASIPLTHPIYEIVSRTKIPLGVASLPLLAVAFLIVVAGGVFLAAMTSFGRAVYALGGGLTSARLMGLNTERTQVGVYALSGFLAALAGITYTFYTSSGNATAGIGLELDVITAVVVGGTVLAGGSGTVLGTLFGVITLGMIQTIITFESTLNSWWTKIVVGALLFIFVVLHRALSAFARRRALRPRNGRAVGQPSSRSMKLALSSLVLVCTLSGLSQACASGPLFSGASPVKCPHGMSGGRMVRAGLYQLTGTFLQPGQTVFPQDELPDPAPPYVNDDGSVEIYGSARYFIRYASWKEYARGGCYRTIQLPIFNPGLSGFTAVYSQPWDLRKFRLVEKAKPDREVIIGGTMSPSHGRPDVVWPDDNINRRIYYFWPDKKRRWVREANPIVGQMANEWLGHSYGGNLIQEDTEVLNVIRTDSEKDVAFFYEKVSATQVDGPYKTEIFAVKVDHVGGTVKNSEIPILTLGDQPYPSTHRTIGGYLVEGPRPVQVEIRGKKFFLVGFSSGDFPTDSYTINYMWSPSLFGPYQPVLGQDKSDLFDLGATLKQTYGLSWVGRPAIYRAPDGGYEMLFHGVMKDILADNDYTMWPSRYDLWQFYRCIFRVRIRLSLDSQGVPVISPALDSVRL